MTFQLKIGSTNTISIEYRIFFFNQRSYFLVKLGGSLSFPKIVSYRIKLLIMLKTILVKIPTFSSTVVFKKALCQLNVLIALFISSIFASL